MSGRRLPKQWPESLRSATTVKSSQPLGVPLASPRPYVAAAAAAVLAALYFVPSASATPQHAPATSAHAAGAVPTAQRLDLADTGSIDTKPYVIGGSAFLMVGAALVVDATRRARRAAL
jgi:hypothetical protein